MISENLQKLREERGFTKTQLSKKANIHFQTIKKIEKGISKEPTITTMKKLADALDITVNDLIK